MTREWKKGLYGGLAALGFALAMSGGASAYTSERCDRDGDRCASVHCDRDRDECRRTVYNRYGRDRDDRYRYGYHTGYGYHTSYGYGGYHRKYVCDRDHDRCRWITVRY